MMLKHKGLITVVCASSTVVSTAAVMFALQSTRAHAQSGSDCEILWE